LTLSFVMALVCAYLLGSVPTAYLFGKMIKGIDIREHGSGNVGATNAFRVLGKEIGTIVLLLDIAKGVLAVSLIGDMFSAGAVEQRVLLAVAAVCGHNWTVFLRFKGGKGIATSLGVLIGLTFAVATLRPVVLGALAAWILIFLPTGYVSLASLVAASLLPILMIATNQPPVLLILGFVFCFFVIFRHRPNIKRLFAGNENRAPLPWIKKKSTK